MNILKRTHFINPPILFAAWTGAGNVGILSVDYIRNKLNSHMFAQIDMSQLVTPDSIAVTDGIVRFPDTPQSVFYHNHNPDLVLFESNAHAGGMKDVEVMRAILELAVELEIPRIYTAAALPQSISHVAPSGMHYACNNAKLKSELEQRELSAMPNGVISGLNGLLLGFAATKGIDAVCLLATIPSYASGLTYPKAAIAIVQKFSEIMGISIDTGELEEESQKAEPMFEDIEEKLKGFFSSEIFESDQEFQNAVEGGGGREKTPGKDVPEYVMERIEELFKSAKNDRSKARELKTELDKWGLYKYYEDRFLDLFENEG